MEKRQYKCQYCRKKYVPKKRRIQKYCSASCRSKAYHQRKSTDSNLKVARDLESGLKQPKTDKYKIDRMSVAGVGNAAVGNITADLITKVLTPEKNRPATKGDISRIEEKLGRFQRVLNIPNKPDGTFPFFDSVNQIIVYRKQIL
ncbi:hypothetical protein [Constantimarinum furrinae]|uniref:hypothetical protein n=1 Tax=Constantimarinum furrinae TaxID=2562285 RepID=UPI00164B9DE2|nr:hypothetical protein [Constantimarinum furrinae]